MTKIIKYCFLFFVIFNACKKDKHENPIIPDIDYPFAAFFNGQFWKPTMTQHSKYFNNLLNIWALDSTAMPQYITPTTKGKYFEIKIYNPQIGKNKITTSDQGSFMLMDCFGNLGDNYYSYNGEVNLIEFDTINSIIKGTFNTVFRSNTKTINVTGGEFHVELLKLFCPVSYQIVNSSNTLWNKWYLIGIYNHQTTVIDPPPCNSSIYFNITNDTLLHTVVRLIHNTLYGQNFIKNDSIIAFSNFASTLVGGSDYEMFYEERVENMCSNQQMVYKLQNNILELKKSNGDKLIFYK